MQEEFIAKIISEFVTGGVFCLSEAPNIGLMWSHYADSHKGYCVGYERNSGNLLGSEKCNPISYGSFPILKLSELFNALETKGGSLSKKVFESMVLSKDPNWHYEKEWRLLFDQVNQLVKVDAEIRSVTFGLRMAEETKIEIRKALSHKSAIQFFQAEKPKRGWDLDIRKIA